MSVVFCGIIVPRHREFHFDEDYLPECILPNGHPGEEHVFRTQEGKYIAWKDDSECGCCDPETDEPCFEYWEIAAESLQDLIKRRK